VLAVIAMTATLTTSLAACGGDQAADTGTAPPASPSSTALSTESVATIARYTGVTPGKATGTPIKIGFVNADAQELVIAVDEVIRAVNDTLGGVRGHPLQLVKCVVGTADQAQKCAQTFADDPATVAVLQGTIDADVSGFHSVLAPKVPVLGGLPLALADASSPNSYYLSSGQFGGLGAVTYAKTYAKARKVSVLSPGGSPANELAVATLEQAFEAVDIDVTVARFAPDATDLSQAVTASQAANADLLIPTIGIPQHCVALSNTLQKMAVYTPVLTFAGCLGSDVRKTLGDYPRWNYLGFSVSAEASTPDDATAWQVRAFNEWFRPLEDRSVTRNGGVQIFQTVLALVKILNSVPGDTFSPAVVGNAMKRFGGPVFLGVPRLSFGAVPGQPGIGSLDSRVYVYLGNDTWRDTTGGQWLSPPNPNQRQGQGQSGGPTQSQSQGTR
jgi:branched-chain amino acid transport system substrate-binding protein